MVGMSPARMWAYIDYWNDRTQQKLAEAEAAAQQAALEG